MDDFIKTIRAHHGMCLSYFVGEGYSAGFSAHMAKTKKMLETEDPLCRIVVRTDDICSRCPNNISGICKDQEKVLSYDRSVLSLCGMDEDVILRWSDFQTLVKKKVLEPQKRQSVCSDCRWNDLCY